MAHLAYIERDSLCIAEIFFFITAIRINSAEKDSDMKTSRSLEWYTLKATERRLAYASHSLIALRMIDYSNKDRLVSILSRSAVEHLWKYDM